MLPASKMESTVLVYIKVVEHPKLDTHFDYTSETIQGKLAITHREASAE
jgi:hypothetical protein